MSQRTNFRRQLRITIADFSQGRLPSYSIDTFPTPEGILGIKLEPKVQLGFGKDAINTKTSVNIYWFCKHLEDSGWLVEKCFIGEEPKTDKVKIKIGGNTTVLTRHQYVREIKYNNVTLLNVPYKPVVYILVRKIDDSDIESNIKKIKNKSNKND